MANVSDILYTKKDVGKNVYRKRTTYILTVEEDFIAENTDKAQDMSMDTGLDYGKIKSDLNETKGVSEVHYVDANYSDSEMSYIGKIKYDTDTYNQTFEEAMENEDLHIDTYADENEPNQLTKIKLVEPLTEKEESDIDVAIQLQAEEQRGK